MQAEFVWEDFTSIYHDDTDFCDPCHVNVYEQEKGSFIELDYYCLVSFRTGSRHR
jgi:hypothetical protein